MPSIKLANGDMHEVEVSVADYRDAHAANMSLPQFLNTRFLGQVDEKRDGSAFDQLVASAGLLMNSDSISGYRPPTVEEAMEGKAEMMALGNILDSGIQANEGNAISKDNDPASRILFPAIVIEATEGKLRDNNEGFISLFNSQVSRNDVIAGEKFEQPIIDMSPVDDGWTRPMPISQGATPHGMPTIKAADIARTIPHYAMGLEITHQAQRVTSLPLVTAVLTRRAEHERYAIVLDAIDAMLNGDADRGYGALPVTNMSTFDGTLLPGQLTQRAWVKFLMNKYLRRQIDWVWGDFDTIYKLQERVGKPTIQTDDATSPRIDAPFRLANPQWQGVNVMMVPDGVVPADTLVGIDSRYAMWRVESSTVNYQAVEDFVMRRVTSFRWDMGFMYMRQFDDAWDVGFLA